MMVKNILNILSASFFFFFFRHPIDDSKYLLSSQGRGVTSIEAEEAVASSLFKGPCIITIETRQLPPRFENPGYTPEG